MLFRKKYLGCVTCCSRTVDAEKHYKKVVIGLKEKIKTKLEKIKDTNTGKGFIMFSDDRIVKDLRYLGQKYFAIQT